MHCCTKYWIYPTEGKKDLGQLTVSEVSAHLMSDRKLSAGMAVQEWKKGKTGPLRTCPRDVSPPHPHPFKPGWPQGPFRELTERCKGRGWIRSLNLLNHFLLPFFHFCTESFFSDLHCTSTQRNDHLSGPQKCIGGACGALNETGPHMLLCLNAWLPAGETVEEG